MKFSLIIGNPPYNNDIYIDFVTDAHKLSSEFVCMITPAKWQGKGGEKNEQFRKDIIPYMSKVVYFPDCGDVFNIGDVGGISYYLISKKANDTCEILNRCNTNSVINGKTAYRSLIKGLSCYCESIIDKMANCHKFKIDDTFRKYNYMITTPPAIGGTKGESSFLFGKTGMCQCIKIGEIYDISEARELPSHYKVICSADNSETLRSKMSFIYSRFVRFLVLVGLTTQSILTPETWRFVPDPGSFDHIFTDEELYEKYGLTQDEINIIESVIKKR